MQVSKDTKDQKANLAKKSLIIIIYLLKAHFIPT